jgi:glutamyl-tRNA synthetase
MGISRAEGEEKFSLQEMIGSFRLESVTLGGPVFDLKKLRWLNGRYIRESYDTPGLLVELEKWALGSETLSRIVPLAQPRLETLSDWGYLTAFFFADEVPFRAEEIELRGKTKDEVAAILQLLIWRLEDSRDVSSAAIETIFRDLAERAGVKLRDFMPPFYVAITGSRASTPLFQSMEILGSDLVRLRLRRAVEALGGLSAKKLKELEKTYASWFGERA